MNIKENVNMILKEVKPTKDLMEVTDIIEGGYIDSFELMHLITRLGEVFEIEIGATEIVPENFNSADAIVAMVENLK